MRLSLLLLWVSLCSNLQVFAQSSDTGQNYALVFYVDSFDHWLDFPKSATEQVLDICTELENVYNFQVEKIQNPNRKQILDKLIEYHNRKFNESDQLLIYFSLHGHYEDGGTGAIIPKDGKQVDPAYESWITHPLLEDLVNRIPCDHILLSLDACYSGTFGPKFRSKPTKPNWDVKEDCLDKIQNALQHNSRLYLTSGGVERTPTSSQFADKWLEALRLRNVDGVLGFHELYSVLSEANPKPMFGDFRDHVKGGDFIFVHQQYCNDNQQNKFEFDSGILFGGGELYRRDMASDGLALAHFGANPRNQSYLGESSSLSFRQVDIATSNEYFIKIHYSKHTDPGVPVDIYLDREDYPRYSFDPEVTGDWETFEWTKMLPLGQIEAGTHEIIFKTEGQDFGVADLDHFILTADKEPQKWFDETGTFQQLYECEYPDYTTIGYSGFFTYDASDNRALWANNGKTNINVQFIQYNNIELPDLEELFFDIKYTMYYGGITPFQIFLDNETKPRAEVMIDDYGSPLHSLVWTKSVSLGKVEAGTHIIILKPKWTFGEIIFDQFRLSNKPLNPNTEDTKPANSILIEGESPNLFTTGKLIYRSNASRGMVSGNLGGDYDALNGIGKAKSGYITYQGLEMESKEKVYIKFRYSKNTDPEEAIEVYIDDEPSPRASFLPKSTNDWNDFVWSAPVLLGKLEEGLHTLTLKMKGQIYGIMDLDQITLNW